MLNIEFILRFGLIIGVVFLNIGNILLVLGSSGNYNEGSRIGKEVILGAVLLLLISGILYLR